MRSISQITSALQTAVVAGGVLLALGLPARADTFHITYEAPGVQSANTNALCSSFGTGSCVVGTETFDTRTSGTGFTTDFGTGGVITGNYSATTIDSANQYGGAGGTGNYAVAFSDSPYTVTLSTTMASGINYFGYWLSALDQGNQVSFYKNGVDVYDFTPSDLIAALGSCSGNNPYCTNPTQNFKGQNNQLYAFVNFYDTNGTFDTVRFRENPSTGGYESDNHTVGYVTSQSGTQVAVPEPASIALFGMGLLGLGVARRKRGAN